MNTQTPQMMLDMEISDMPTVTDTKSLLAPYTPIIKECYLAAWNSLQRIPILDPEFGVAATTPRARANNISAIMTRLIVQKFTELDDSRVAIENNHGFLQLVISNRIAIRFKKGNKKGQTSNIPTKQQIRRMWQQPLALDMPPEIVFLDAVYKLDAFDAEIEDLLIQCPFGNRAIWAYSIMQDNADMIRIEMPQQTETPGRPRIRAKQPLAGEEAIQNER